VFLSERLRSEVSRPSAGRPASVTPVPYRFAERFERRVVDRLGAQRQVGDDPRPLAGDPSHARLVTLAQLGNQQIDLLGREQVGFWRGL
jgi:hypothetical protein